eukprot:GILK01000578.1.p1 GENE.GILK01000578.1~~GILK01000578.1.p1  ORF type:complete len:787 (-),score=87.93 GILK01000578.1:303-2663(-)
MSTSKQPKREAGVTSTPPVMDPRVQMQLQLTKDIQSAHADPPMSPKSKKIVDRVAELLDPFNYGKAEIHKIVKECNYDTAKIEQVVADIYQEKAGHQQGAWTEVKKKTKSDAQAPTSSVGRGGRADGRANGPARGGRGGRNQQFAPVRPQTQEPAATTTTTEKVQPFSYASVPVVRQEKPKPAPAPVVASAVSSTPQQPAVTQSKPVQLAPGSQSQPVQAAPTQTMQPTSTTESTWNGWGSQPVKVQETANENQTIIPAGVPATSWSSSSWSNQTQSQPRKQETSRPRPGAPGAPRSPVAAGEPLRSQEPKVESASSLLGASQQNPSIWRPKETEETRPAPQPVLELSQSSSDAKTVSDDPVIMPAASFASPLLHVQFGSLTFGELGSETSEPVSQHDLNRVAQLGAVGTSSPQAASPSSNLVNNTAAPAPAAAVTSAAPSSMPAESTQQTENIQHASTYSHPVSVSDSAAQTHAHQMPDVSHMHSFPYGIPNMQAGSPYAMLSPQGFAQYPMYDMGVPEDMTKTQPQQPGRAAASSQYGRDNKYSGPVSQTDSRGADNKATAASQLGMPHPYSQAPPGMGPIPATTQYAAPMAPYYNPYQYQYSQYGAPYMGYGAMYKGAPPGMGAAPYNQYGGKTSHYSAQAGPAQSSLGGYDDYAAQSSQPQQSIQHPSAYQASFFGQQMDQAPPTKGQAGGKGSAAASGASADYKMQQQQSAAAYAPRDYNTSPPVGVTSYYTQAGHYASQQQPPAFPSFVPPQHQYMTQQQQSYQPHQQQRGSHNTYWNSN